MRSQRSKGSSTVESAMVLMVFLVILFGIGDFAQIFLMHHTLLERARAAARAGAVNNCTDEEIVNIVMYGSRSARSDSGAFGLTPENVQISRKGSEAGARITVAISNLSYKSLSPLIATNLKNLPLKVVVSSEVP